jgi:hypothetical protein
MDLEKLYKIETKKDSKCKYDTNGNLTGMYSNHFVEWLIKRLSNLEKE